MARFDRLFLVVKRGVSGELEQLGAKVLQYGGHVHRGTDFDQVGVLSPAKISVYTDHGKLKSGSLGLGLSADLGFKGFSSS